MKDARGIEVLAYHEFKKALYEYESAQRKAKALRMIARMNNHRPAKRDRAKTELQDLHIPTKPERAHIWQCSSNGDYIGCCYNQDQLQELKDKYGEKLTVKIIPAISW